MKHLTVIIFIFLCIGLESKAIPVAIVAKNVLAEKRIEIPGPLLNQLLKLKPRDITKLTGKRLSLKDKIALMILQHQAKKQLRHPAKGIEHDNGKTAFILGLVGLLCLIIPFLDIASIPLGILAITIGSKAKRINPENKKARTGITLGIITLAIAALAIIILAIVLSTGPIF